MEEKRWVFGTFYDVILYVDLLYETECVFENMITHLFTHSFIHSLILFTLSPPLSPPFPLPSPFPSFYRSTTTTCTSRHSPVAIQSNGPGSTVAYLHRAPTCMIIRRFPGVRAQDMGWRWREVRNGCFMCLFDFGVRCLVVCPFCWGHLHRFVVKIGCSYLNISTNIVHKLHFSSC